MNHFLPLVALAIAIGLVAVTVLRQHNKRTTRVVLTSPARGASAPPVTVTSPVGTVILTDDGDDEKYWRNYYGGRDD